MSQMALNILHLNLRPDNMLLGELQPVVLSQHAEGVKNKVHILVLTM